MKDRREGNEFDNGLGHSRRAEGAALSSDQLAHSVWSDLDYHEPRREGSRGEGGRRTDNHDGGDFKSAAPNQSQHPKRSMPKDRREARSRRTESSQLTQSVWNDVDQRGEVLTSTAASKKKKRTSLNRNINASTQTTAVKDVFMFLLFFSKTCFNVLVRQCCFFLF